MTGRLGSVSQDYRTPRLRPTLENALQINWQGRNDSLWPIRPNLDIQVQLARKPRRRLTPCRFRRSCNTYME